VKEYRNWGCGFIAIFYFYFLFLTWLIYEKRNVYSPKSTDFTKIADSHTHTPFYIIVWTKKRTSKKGKAHENNKNRKAQFCCCLDLFLETQLHCVDAP